MSEPEFIDVWEGPTVADELWHQRNGSEHYEEDTWTPLDLSEIPDEPPVRPTLGGLGIAYPGKRHVFSGPQESAKTLCAYVLAIEVVRGGGKVALIDFEMGRWDAKRRLLELGATVDEIRAMPYFEPAEPATEASVDRIVALGPELVVIDAAAGAYDLQGLDDNKRGDVERFTRIYVSRFWRSGIATVVLDHVTKNAETRGNYAIGSERKVGGADVHLGFGVVTPIKRGGQGVYKITTHKDRGGFLKRGKLAEFELHSDPETHTITWALREATEADEEHPFRPTHLMEKVSRYLERVVDPPVTTNTIEKEKLGKAEYVREALSVLVAEGFVEETAGPNRARLFESIVAYREAFDERSTGSSPVRPGFVPDPGESGSSVRPSPYGGDVRDGLVPRDALGSSRAPDEDPGF